MLEQFISDARAVARHRGGVFGPYIDGIAAGLAAEGYARQSVKVAVCLLSNFGRWVAARNLPVSAISEQTVREFRRVQGQPSWGQQGNDATLRRLLGRLRFLGVAPEAVRQDECTPAERLCEEFGRYLRQERGLSAATVLNFCPAARLFIRERFGTGIVDLSGLCAADLQTFVLRHAREYRSEGVHRLLTGLRSFLRFLHHRGEIPSPLADQVPKAPRWRRSQPPKWLSVDEVKRVLDSCDRSSATGQRDYAMLLLLARLGLRGGEIVSLELEDIRWEAGEFTVCGKGQQRKRFPLPDDVGEALAAYVKNARQSQWGSRRVFLRTKAPYRGLAGVSTLNKVVRQALLRAGLAPPCKGSHLFRHSLATNMLRNGATLTEIGQILHHTDPDTTSIYAKVDIAGLRALALPWPGDPS
jgi:site-specific recombinase XerD